MPRRSRRALAAMIAASLAGPALGASTLFDDGAVSGPVVPNDDPGSLIGDVSKQINIDGKLVNVSVSVTNVWFTLYSSGNLSVPVSTSVRVNLDSADDQDLPQVRAVRIKLERVKPPMRIYKSQLFSDATLTLVYDPKHAGYGGTITAFRPGVRLKATVTLTTADETRIVRVGEVRVRPLGPIIWSGGEIAE